MLFMIVLVSVFYVLYVKCSVSVDTALALDCDGCIETFMFLVSVMLVVSKVIYDDAVNGFGVTVQDGLDGFFVWFIGLTFVDLVGGSDVVIVVIVGDGFVCLLDLVTVVNTGLFSVLEGIPVGLLDGDDDI